MSATGRSNVVRKLDAETGARLRKRRWAESPPASRWMHDRPGSIVANRESRSVTSSKPARCALRRKSKSARAPSPLRSMRRDERLFVANVRSGDISVIDTANGRTSLARVRVGGAPYGVAVDPHEQPDTREPINMATCFDHRRRYASRDRGTIAVGRYPEAVAVIDGKAMSPIGSRETSQFSISPRGESDRDTQTGRGSALDGLHRRGRRLEKLNETQDRGAFSPSPAYAALTACEDRKPDREDWFSDVVERSQDAAILDSTKRRHGPRHLAREQGSRAPAFGRRPDRSSHQTGVPSGRDEVSWNRTAWWPIAQRSLPKCWRRTESRRTPAALIEGLASVVDPKHGKETYGELCQFYFTLRHGGADRDAALMQLSARYGSPGRSVEKTP